MDAMEGLLSLMLEWAHRDPPEADEATVLVGADIVATALAATKAREPKTPIPASARLFAGTMRVVAQVSLPHEPMMGVCVRLTSAKDGFVLAKVYLIGKEDNEYATTGRFRPGDLFVESHPSAQGKPAHALVLFAYMLDLINTPAFVTKDTLPRATRRRIDRNSGTNASDRIRVVSWNLTKPKLEAGETVGCGRHMPLHYTRGHWRQCAAHLDRAQLHDDGVHRMWIEGFWSGHPAYGIVRSIHAPKL